MKRVQVRGLSTVVSNFRAWDRRLREDMQVANIKSMGRVNLDARFRCPVDTRRMQNAITPELSENGLTFRVFVDPKPFAAAGLAYYPLFVHEGTRLMDARPFLLEAFLEERPRYQAEVSAGVKRSLRRG